MTEIRAAAGTDAAQWLLQSDVDWSTLVRCGPPGFDVYARIEFGHVSEAGAASPSGENPVDAVSTALAVLASHTITPDRGYAAIWEGWGGNEPAPEAPRVKIPNRTMLLFTGPVRALRNAAGLAWHDSAIAVNQEPHLVWPEDHAWCLACEVDEEVEFTVGCSGDAYDVLVRDLPGAVRRVPYGEPPPLYRDDLV